MAALMEAMLDQIQDMLDMEVVIIEEDIVDQGEVI